MGIPVLFLFLVTASLTDLKFRSISNFQNIFFFLLGITFAFIENGIRGVSDGLFTALVAFALLYPFFAAKLLGAGDIKFIMAVSAFTGSEGMKKSLIPVAVSAVLILIVMALKEGKLKGLKIPMAVPISLGVLAGTMELVP